MGIKDLKKFLKSKNVPCFMNLPLEELKNTKMAIDTFNWIFTYLNPVIKNYLDNMKNILDPIDEEELFTKLCEEFLKFNNILLNQRITPVWVWDGQAKVCKAKTQTKRREAKLKMIEEKKLIKNVLLNMPLLERNGSDLIDKYRKLVINTQHLPKKYFAKLKEFSTSLGLPTITAKDEAEALASSLAIDGKIKSIWSADTDTYAFGAPLIVKQFVNVNNKLNIECVYTPPILTSLDLTYSQFRDFCIMLGTDFNDRVYKMGPVNSFKLIKQYGSLDEIEKKCEKDISCLNYKYVRLQLTPYKTEFKDSDLVIKNIDMTITDDIKKLIEYDYDSLSYNDRLYTLQVLVRDNKINDFQFLKLKGIDEFLVKIKSFSN